MHVYYGSGVENVCLLDMPMQYCPHKNCDEWLGISIPGIAWLHVTIATALWRKNILTENERVFLQKQPYIRGAMEGGPWRYKRRGQLIECFLLDDGLVPENGTASSPKHSGGSENKMSLECSECERDARSGHAKSCSRYRCPVCRFFGDQHQDECKFAQLEAELQAAGNRVRELEFERDMLLGKSDAVHLGAQAAVTALHQCQAIVAERDELRSQLDRVLSELALMETALKTLYPELRRLADVAQMPLSTVGALLRRQAARAAIPETAKEPHGD